jgi:hypothetical protein
VLITVYNLQCIIRFSLTLMLSSVKTMASSGLGIKYFLNLNEYYLPIFILSIHFRQISFFKITKDIQSNNNNNIVLSMLYAEICPKVRRHNARPLGHISAYNMDDTILLYNTTIFHWYYFILIYTCVGWHFTHM